MNKTIAILLLLCANAFGAAGHKISEYSNLANLPSNFVFVVEDPSGATNHHISWGQVTNALRNAGALTGTVVSATSASTATKSTYVSDIGTNQIPGSGVTGVVANATSAVSATSASTATKSTYVSDIGTNQIPGSGVTSVVATATSATTATTATKATYAGDVSTNSLPFGAITNQAGLTMLATNNGVNLTNIGGVKIWTGTLTQTVLNAPIATVHQNTLGTIVWSRVAAGSYDGTLTGAFTTNKTLLLTPSLDAAFNTTVLTRTSANVIHIDTASTDAVLNSHPIRIEVSP